jgi:hypothetical protein
LDEQGNALSQDKNSPLLNRATQGLYPLGGAMLPVIQAAFDGDIPSDAAMLSFLGEAGLLDAPLIAMPVAKREMTNEIEDLRASPLQVCLAAAAVSYQGVLPAPRIATAVNTREQGWVVLPALTEARELIQPKAAAEAALSLLKENGTFWSHSARGRINKTTVTWFIAGTPPDWQGAPLVLVVALEEDNPKFAETLGERLLNAALGR